MVLMCSQCMPSSSYSYMQHNYVYAWYHMQDPGEGDALAAYEVDRAKLNFLKEIGSGNFGRYRSSPTIHVWASFDILLLAE